LKKDNVQMGAALEDMANTTSDFYKWEIANATIDQMNYYQISTGEEDTPKYVQREISFKVEVDPDRNVEPIKGYTLFFDPRGRSNNESRVERQTWE
jgi:hypothetical protein